MTEMAISVVIFGVILLIGLILLLVIYPKVLNVAVDAIKKFIKQLGCALCRAALPHFICWGC